MRSLLDTNFLAEQLRPDPNRGWAAWLAAAKESELCISVVSLAEIRFRIERLAPGIRKQSLERWLNQDLRPRFGLRTLDVTAAVADVWGRVTAERAASGRPMEGLDAFIAATCIVHQLQLVTRNLRHFEGVVTDIVNPWS